MTANTAYILDERRSSDRISVSIIAKGIVPNNDEALECRIIDLSENGAKIEVLSADIMPETFKLFIPDTNCLCECRVVRRAGKEIGLEFDSKITL